MKAVVEVAKRGSAIRSARKQLVAARNGQSPDFHLSFESALVLTLVVWKNLGLSNVLKPVRFPFRSRQWKSWSRSLRLQLCRSYA
jgi:hypothetical protein